MSLAPRYRLEWPQTAASLWSGSFSTNIYDGHTLPATLTQTTELVGSRQTVAICDRGYRGTSYIDGTTIEIPKNPGKRATIYQKQKARKRFRRRAGIETIIGHLKSDYRLMRNYLKGSLRDSINLMLAAAAFNFKKLVRQLQMFLRFCIILSFQRTCEVTTPTNKDKKIKNSWVFQGRLDSIYLPLIIKISFKRHFTYKKL